MLLVVENRIKAFAVPRPTAGEHLPSDQPKTIDVGTPIEHTTVDLLGRHVGRSSERDAVHRELRFVRHRPREAEVGEHGTSVIFDEDVFRLDVAMDEAHRVRGRECTSDVAQDSLDTLRREEAVAAEHLPEGSPREMLHHDRDGGTVEIEYGADRYDVRVLQLLDQSGFAREARQSLLVVHVLGSNHLDRDLGTGRALARQIDDRGTAATQLAEYFVLGVEHGERRWREVSAH